jgi:hypothetical protein
MTRLTPPPPPAIPALTSHKPISTINGLPVIVHDRPMNNTDIAAWEANNAESMGIIGRTTRPLPPW